MNLHVTTAAEFSEFFRAESRGFGEYLSPRALDLERTVAEHDRNYIGLDGDDIVATAGSYGFDLTVAGGTSVAVAGVTSVTVAPTHRRRGLLRSMMRRQLDDCAARGDVAAVLYASSSAIYSRFGYGLASEYQSIEIDTREAAFAFPGPERSLRMCRKEDALHIVAPLYDAYRGRVPGSVSRSESWWRIVLGEERRWKGGGPNYVVIADPVEGDPGGYVIFELEDLGEDVKKRLVVRELVAATVDCQAALWRFCFEHDLAVTVTASYVALDDPLPWRLVDPRSLKVTAQSDFLWLRLLDVPAALEARSYRADGVIRLDVVDDFCPSLGGVFELTVSDGAGRCRRVDSRPASTATSTSTSTSTDASVDLTLDVGDLASLYLGGVDCSTLWRAGRLGPVSPGVLRLVDDVFATERKPFCNTPF